MWVECEADAAVACLGDGGGPVGEVAASNAVEFRGLMAGTAVSELLVGNVDVDGTGEEIEADAVAIFDKGDGSADDGFRGAVDSDGTVGDAGYAGIGDEGDFAIEFGDGEGGGGDKHFRHAAGDRSEVAKDDDAAGGDFSLFNSADDVAGVVEADGVPGEGRCFHAGNFENDAFRGEVTEADLHVCERFVAVFAGDEEILTGGWWRDIAEVFSECFAGDCDAGSVEQSGIEEMFEQHRCTTDTVQVDHSPGSTGCEAAEHRGVTENFLKVFESEVDTGFAGEGEDMEDAVGGTAGGGDGDCGVSESGFGEDIAGSEVECEEVVHGGADVAAFGFFLRINGWNGAACGEHQADGFHGESPGIERGSDAAASGSWAGTADDFGGLFLGHGANGSGCLGVIDVEDRDVFVFPAAWHNGAAADEQSWEVGASERHGEAGAVFIAVMQADKTVVAVCGYNAFGTVGDEIAGRQAGIAAFVALRNVVADGGGAEGESEKTGFSAAGGDFLSQLVGVYVARVAVKEGNADADLRAAEVGFGHTDCVIEGGDTFLPSVGE